MSHTGVDVVDFLFYTIYPVIGIFVVEIISRLVKAPKMDKIMDTSNCINWFWNLLLVHFTSTTKFSINCNGDVCTCYCFNLSRKTSKNFS